MRDDARKRLAAEVRETVPPVPGVYALLDGGGRLLYIGKSVNLRQRMGSYFARDPLNAELHLGQLVANTRSFAWWQTRSELLALLLEDVLIKEHLPPHNTRQREFLENRYLELTDHEFPACLIVDHTSDFGMREVFGPMKDRYFAASLQDILHEALGIRTCSDPEPNRRCLEHDIGRCSGPCRGAVEPAEYGELVARARNFLRGNAEELLDRLVTARDRAAVARHYEEAARLRDVVETCRRYEAHEQFARRFKEGGCTIQCESDGIVYRFEDGALAAPHVVVAARGRSEERAAPSRSGFDPEEAEPRSVAALRQSPFADRRFLADRTRIVCSWVRRRRHDCHVRFEEAGGPAAENERARKTELA